MITGYGSYGQSCSLDFQSENISLLNRGWVLAFSHVRGGGELGTLWHDQGKKLNKKNSFHDFLYCCDYLIEKNYTQPDLLTAYGSSAGGLLVATSCILWKPELFHSIILEVPFVDIVTSMTNSELPLTIHEYEEWGNPKVTEELENILSYDPYFNLKPVLDKTNFPQIFLIGSTADIRVPYWHPVKFAAKLRKILSESPNISNSLVLLQINDDNTGHFGEGGKYSQFIQISRIYSFLIASIQNVIQSKKENQINSKRKYSF